MDICGLVLCRAGESRREVDMLQTRGDVRISIGKEAEGRKGEYTDLEEMVKFLTQEFSRKLPDLPPMTLARPIGIMDSLARGSVDHSEPSILASQYNTPANGPSLNETVVQDSTFMDNLQVVEENESFSFLHMEGQRLDFGPHIQSSLFSTDLTLNRVLEQLEKEDLDKIPEEQDLDSVPVQRISPIHRRVSETILTRISRKPPVYPKPPTSPRPVFTRKASGLARTKSLKVLDTSLEAAVPDPVVFSLTSRQLEQYALEYHRPRRTGLMYTGLEEN